MNEKLTKQNERLILITDWVFGFPIVVAVLSGCCALLYCLIQLT